MQTSTLQHQAYNLFAVEAKSPCIGIARDIRARCSRYSDMDAYDSARSTSSDVVNRAMSYRSGITRSRQFHRNLSPAVTLHRIAPSDRQPKRIEMKSSIQERSRNVAHSVSSEGSFEPAQLSFHVIRSASQRSRNNSIPSSIRHFDSNVRHKYKQICRFGRRARTELLTNEGFDSMRIVQTTLTNSPIHRRSRSLAGNSRPPSISQLMSAGSVTSGSSSHSPNASLEGARSRAIKISARSSRETRRNVDMYRPGTPPNSASAKGSGRKSLA